MSRRRSVMSESFKYELAKDLGFYDVVQREGWEGIRTKDAGNMVKRAIQIAEEALAKQYTPGGAITTGSQSPQPYAANQHPQGGYVQPQAGQQPGVQHSFAQTAYNQNAGFYQQPHVPGAGGQYQPAQTTTGQAYPQATQFYGNAPATAGNPYFQAGAVTNAGSYSQQQHPYSS